MSPLSSTKNAIVDEHVFMDAAVIFAELSASRQRRRRLLRTGGTNIFVPVFKKTIKKYLMVSVFGWPDPNTLRKADIINYTHHTLGLPITSH